VTGSSIGDVRVFCDVSKSPPNVMIRGESTKAGGTRNARRAVSLSAWIMIQDKDGAGCDCYWLSMGAPKSFKQIAEEYRKLADRAEHEAELLPPSKVRDTYRRLAELWTDLAQAAEAITDDDAPLLH
jgi:hypothetical protein